MHAPTHRRRHNDPPAILYEEDVPPQWEGYIELNAEMAPQCPQIVERKTPLAREGEI